MGSVIDTSGGALPGVTITISRAPAAPLTVITDESGRYLSPWLVPGSYRVTFTLSGFETREADVRLEAGQTLVLDQQLPLAGLSETVQVTAPAPPPPPPPPPLAPMPPRPKPKPIVKPDPELLASVCGPRQPPELAETLGHIVSHRDEPGRQLLGPRDVARIDAGESRGLAVGQNYVIRRRFSTGNPAEPKRTRSVGEQTVGLAQIVETHPSLSYAIIVYTCGEIFAGDTLEPYVAQPARFTVLTGAPHFEEPAHIAFAEYNHETSASGQMLVIDRGLLQGVQRGQRLTIFRRREIAESPVIIGEGIVVAVRLESATMKIDQTIDAVYVSDLIALHR
jgi:hypothetical protein